MRVVAANSKSGMLKMSCPSSWLVLSSNIFFFCLVGFFTVVFLTPAETHAQNAGPGTQLFTPSATIKADKRSNQRNREVRSKILAGTHNDSRLVHDLKLDTVEDIVWSSRKQEEFFIEYRGLSYFVDVRDVVDLGEINELGTSSFAEKLFFFQTAKTLARFVVESPLEPLYRRVAKEFKRIKNYTTVRVVQGGKGDLGVRHGSVEGERLLEFKLHASARNGVEPRLRMGDHLLLRYNPLREDTLLEYRHNF